MAWVDLGDLYVKKAGDNVTGSIVMANNNLSVAYDADTTYNVGTEIKSLRDSVSRYKVAYGTTIIHKGNNYFWDLMSFESAARSLDCSVSDFFIQDTGIGNLFCFICSGDSFNATDPAIVEFDVSRSQIRLRFTNANACVFRANWMLALVPKE